MNLMINKHSYKVSTDDLEKNLLEFIREDCGLTGAKNGCGIGSCGVCTVLFDNTPTRSCTKTVKEALGKEITTIEGLSPSPDNLHPLQQAFIDCGAIQCGFCTPAMVLTGHALLLKNNQPTRDEIRAALNPVLCRCTGYQQIIDAVEKAAVNYR